MIEEIWRDVVGYEGLYQVSNIGRVKGVARKVVFSGNKMKNWSEKVLAIGTNKLGYQQITLSNNTKTKRHSVHRLVALAFIERPHQKPDINHIDGNPSNNKVENLEWCTRSENGLHSYRVLGRVSPAKGKPYAQKGSVQQISQNGEVIKTYNCAYDAKQDGFDPCHIYNVINGKRRLHKEFIWKRLTPQQ